MHSELRPRGAAGCLLALLGELVGLDRRVAISLVELSARSGYTVPTIQIAIRQLESARYILRHHPDPRHATVYELIPEEQRRTLRVGELVGLIAPLGGM